MDKINQLRDPETKLTEEERQELILEILKEQLEVANQELVEIRKRNKRRLSKRSSPFKTQQIQRKEFSPESGVTDYSPP